ncbi:MAG: FAD-binding oxidoreductase [Alphaproteobacteria bacterium]|nr:FAD-binding oxidoreductase [Alphaproteobacteria bacterium]
MDIERAVERIKATVGPNGWIADPDEQEPYLTEARRLYRGATRLVVRPASTAEVAAVVRICAEAVLPIVPQGGNTGLVGGGVPPEDGHNIVLALGRMNRIRAIDPVNFTMTVEAGCILAQLQQAASEVDRLFPLSLGAEGSCQIGGNLSTNAGGIAVLRYGNARELTLGLEVVLPDGQVWDALRGLRKDNTGYDLKQLFIGGEGTLGIITAATVKLFPKPCEVETALLGLARVEDVMELFARARAATADQLTAFELIPRAALDLALVHVPGTIDPLPARHPWYVLLELSSSQTESGIRGLLERLLETALDEELIANGVIAESGAQAKELWRIREAIVEAQNYSGSIKHDVSVPVSRVAEFIIRATAGVRQRLPAIRPMAFGHVGDGNIHFNLTQPERADTAAYLARWQEFNDIVHGVVRDLGGSISAEHGVGRMKCQEITHYKSPVEIELMRRVKCALDPANIMNPGKVVSPQEGSPDETGDGSRGWLD